MVVGKELCYVSKHVWYVSTTDQFCQISKPILYHYTILNTMVLDVNKSESQRTSEKDETESSDKVSHWGLVGARKSPWRWWMLDRYKRDTISLFLFYSSTKYACRWKGFVGDFGTIDFILKFTSVRSLPHFLLSDLVFRVNEGHNWT